MRVRTVSGGWEKMGRGSKHEMKQVVISKEASRHAKWTAWCEACVLRAARGVI